MRANYLTKNNKSPRKVIDQYLLNLPRKNYPQYFGKISTLIPRMKRPVAPDNCHFKDLTMMPGGESSTM